MTERKRDKITEKERDREEMEKDKDRERKRQINREKQRETDRERIAQKINWFKPEHLHIQYTLLLLFRKLFVVVVVLVWSSCGRKIAREIETDIER